MNVRRLVPILIAVVLIAFGIGFLSLRYNDNYRFTSLKSGNLINIKSRDGIVKIGSDGIEVKDGNDHVVIGWDGIKVNEGGKFTFRIGNIRNWNWFGFSEKDLKWETVKDEKFAEIAGINDITVTSPFVDIKVTSQDRDDVRIHYYGTMKSNVVPTLDVKKGSNKLNIKLQNSNTNNYSVMESDVVLEVFIPKSFNGSFNTSTSSGNIYMKNLVGENFNTSSSSGDLELENLEGKVFNIATSSGVIEMEDSIGEIKIASSSGDITLDNKITSEDIKISTSSGDVSIKLGEDASYKINGNTLSGDIIYNGPISVEKDKSGRFEFTIGSGDKSININTSSGDIVFSNK